MKAPAFVPGLLALTLLPSMLLGGEAKTTFHKKKLTKNAAGAVAGQGKVGSGLAAKSAPSLKKASTQISAGSGALNSVQAGKIDDGNAIGGSGAFTGIKPTEISHLGNGSASSGMKITGGSEGGGSGGTGGSGGGSGGSGAPGKCDADCQAAKADAQQAKADAKQEKADAKQDKIDRKLNRP